MDFSRYYHSRTKDSVDEDRTAIVAGFRQLLKQGPSGPLRLVNYYKGLPISYPATLAEINGDRIDLDVHRQQAVVLDRTKRVFIKSGFFEFAMLAEARYVDRRRAVATLGDFLFVEIMAERREALRLQLEQPTEAWITGPDTRLSGSLFDISLGGFSIHTEDRCCLEKGTEVRLKLQIPNLLQNTVTTIETGAQLVDTLREQGTDICRFSFEAEPQSEAAISRFIFQRQVEIIREIKEES